MQIAVSDPLTFTFISIWKSSSYEGHFQNGDSLAIYRV